MDELMIPELEHLAREEQERKRTESTTPEKVDESWLKWRDLIPVIKADVSEVMSFSAEIF